MFPETIKAVVFDLDRTFWQGTSLEALAKIGNRRPKFGEKVSLYWALAKYSFGILSPTRFFQSYARTLQDYPWELFERECEEAYQRFLRPKIYQEVVHVYEYAKNHNLICISASASPVEIQNCMRRDFSFERLGGTQLERKGNLYTGRLIGEPCYGVFKFAWVAQTLASLNFSLKEAAFLSDSITDLPILESVGYPVVVNPDIRLKKILAKRKWKEILTHNQFYF